jgi:pimeloyl-ACP methyl ester carboxylesterase
MQFAYQFPERCERMVLVSSGGLGHELHLMLRAAALPGAEWVLPLLCSSALCDAVNGVARFFSRAGLRAGPDLEEIWHSFVSLSDPDARQAFIHTVRTVIDIRGQRASAGNRLYLAAEMPTMILWGAHDPLIPVAHAYSAHECIHESRLEIFTNAGHFPYRDDPWRFVELLVDFIESTASAQVDEQRWRERLRRGSRL